MPSFKDLSCQIERGCSHVPCPDLGVKYSDSKAVAYIKAPSSTSSLDVHISSQAFIAPGLIVLVYVDGVLRFERRRRDLTVPKAGSQPHESQIDFRFNLASLIDSGRGESNVLKWAGRLSHSELLKDKNIDSPESGADVTGRNGIIEVLVLRCFGSHGQSGYFVPDHSKGEGDRLPTNAKTSSFFLDGTDDAGHSPSSTDSWEVISTSARLQKDSRVADWDVVKDSPPRAHHHHTSRRTYSPHASQHRHAARPVQYAAYPQGTPILYSNAGPMFADSIPHVVTPPVQSGGTYYIPVQAQTTAPVERVARHSHVIDGHCSACEEPRGRHASSSTRRTESSSREPPKYTIRTRKVSRAREDYDHGRSRSSTGGRRDRAVSPPTRRTTHDRGHGRQVSFDDDYHRRDREDTGRSHRYPVEYRDPSRTRARGEVGGYSRAHKENVFRSSRHQERSPTPSPRSSSSAELIRKNTKKTQFSHAPSSYKYGTATDKGRVRYRDEHRVPETSRGRATSFTTTSASGDERDYHPSTHYYRESSARPLQRASSVRPHRNDYQSLWNKPVSSSRRDTRAPSSPESYYTTDRSPPRHHARSRTTTKPNPRLRLIDTQDDPYATFVFRLRTGSRAAEVLGEKTRSSTVSNATSRKTYEYPSSSTREQPHRSRRDDRDRDPFVDSDTTHGHRHHHRHGSKDAHHHEQGSFRRRAAALSKTEMIDQLVRAREALDLDSDETLAQTDHMGDPSPVGSRSNSEELPVRTPDSASRHGGGFGHGPGPAFSRSGSPVYGPRRKIVITKKTLIPPRPSVEVVRDREWGGLSEASASKAAGTGDDAVAGTKDTTAGAKEEVPIAAAATEWNTEGWNAPPPDWGW